MGVLLSQRSRRALADRDAGIGDLGDLLAAWDDFRDTADDAIAIVGPFLASIAEAILSFVPGIGTALATALAFGVALAMGKRIDGALIDVAAAAMPGGPVAQMAFKTAATIGDRLLRGERVDQVAIDTVRANLPGGKYALMGFDATIALVQGKPIDAATLAAIRENLPGGELSGRAFDVTVELAKGRPVSQIAIDEARALLPSGAAVQAFDATIVLARGGSLEDLAVKALRAQAAERGGDIAAQAFDLSVSIARGQPIDAIALRLVRDQIPADPPELRDAFDRAISIAHGRALQGGAFVAASTFMRWTPAAGDTAYGDGAWDAPRGKSGVGYDPHGHELADKMLDFLQASATAARLGSTPLAVLERWMLDDLATLPADQHALLQPMIEHLARYRSDYEHDLQDVPADVLAGRFASDVFGRPVSEVITRAALGSVPYVAKPAFDSRKAKRRGEVDIHAAFVAAIPDASRRRVRFLSAIDLFAWVDDLLLRGWKPAEIVAYAHSLPRKFNGEAAALTPDQVFARIALLRSQGRPVAEDFAEWHLGDDSRAAAELTWKTEAAFLAAATLPTAAEYRRRAKLETDLAARELNGTTEGRGRDLVNRARADVARAEAIERETARLAAGLARNSMATGGGGLTSIDEARDAEAQRVFDLDRSRDVALRMAAAETEAAAAKRAGAASADRRRRILAAVGLALGGLVIVARVRK